MTGLIIKNVLKNPFGACSAVCNIGYRQWKSRHLYWSASQ